MKKLLSLLLVLSLTISSTSIFADENAQTITELKAQLTQYRSQLRELQIAFDDAEFDQEKARIEMNEGLMRGAVTAIAVDVAVPTILMGLLFHGPQGGALGMMGAIKNIPSVLKMFYSSSIGLGFLAVTTIGTVSYMLYKGRYVLSLDHDQFEKLQNRKNKLENRIEETLERIADLSGSVNEL